MTAGSGPLIDLLIIDDQVLNAVLQNEACLQLVPCLSSGKRLLVQAGKGCGTCRQRQARSRKEAIRQLKTCIANLRGDRAIQFKRLLNARKICLFLEQGNGKMPIRLTY